MKLISIISSILSVLNTILAYLSPRFIKAKEPINQKIIDACERCEKLSDDELAIAMRPVILWASASVFVLALITQKLFGREDPDASELSMLLFILLAFCGLSLIRKQEFKERLQVLFREIAQVTFWVTLSVAALTIILVWLALSFKSATNPHPEDSTIAMHGITNGLTSLVQAAGLAFLILILFFSAALIAFPLVLRKAFLFFVRKVAKFILKYETRDPVRIPLLMLSIFFIQITARAYIKSKII